MKLRQVNAQFQTELICVKSRPFLSQAPLLRQLMALASSANVVKYTLHGVLVGSAALRSSEDHADAWIAQFRPNTWTDHVGFDPLHASRAGIDLLFLPNFL